MNKIIKKEMTLFDALKECVFNNALITTNKLSDGESIHAYKGKLYYEDGCIIGSLRAAYSFLNIQEWTRDAKWYVIGYFSDEDLKRLRELHESTNRYVPGFFNDPFMKIVNGEGTVGVLESSEKENFKSCRVDFL